MGLRLLLSTALASLIVVGCPLTDRLPAQSRSPALARPAGTERVEQAPRSLGVVQVANPPPPRQVARRVQRSQAADVASDPGALEAEPAAPLGRDALALHEDLMPGRTLGALSKEAVVYSEPRRSSHKLGFLRQGALVRRDADPAGHEGCDGGWYRIAPEGYVCVGKTATLDLNHPLLQLASRRPDRGALLPYEYARARFPTPPLYTKLPTRAQQEQVELDLVAQGRRRPRLDAAWDHVSFSEVPDFLKRGERVPRPFGYQILEKSFVSGTALPETGFAFLQFYEHEGRRWGLTTDLSIVPLDRVQPVKASAFHGIALAEGASLPVVFTRSKGAYLYQGDPRTTGLKIDRLIGYREAVPITGQKLRIAGVAYLQTQAGGWIVDEHLVRVDPPKSSPSWAKQGRSWIEVSILDQTLVAYEGERPVFATLVSTGIGGLGDPAETHATVRGTFLIHTKHVSATMNNEDVGDEFDLRDVPYVQYFQDGYAFHAAYWHDAFGRPRSHGCINLSPADARWLFHWTEPSVPPAWHSRLSLRGGTLVYIHP